MNKRTSLSRADMLNVVGLVAAAAGIFILFATGVAAQSVPVGAILLLVVAGLVAFFPRWWTPIVGVVLPLFIFLVAAFVAPGLVDYLTHPSELSWFVGTWVQMVGLITAIVAGIVATVQNYRTRRVAVSR